MSLLGSQVYANPTKSLWASSSGGGGGSYPRDASFNSIVVNPTGTLPPAMELGTIGSNIGFYALDEDGNPGAEFISFTASQMDLSNVSTINGSNYPPALPANPTFTSVSSTDASFTRINGAVYPPAIGEVSVIRTGVLNFNAPTGNVSFSTPFSARPTITVQPTTLPPWSGGVEGSGFFFIESADSNGFRVGFSGNIAFFDPMPLMWMAVGS